MDRDLTVRTIRCGCGTATCTNSITVELTCLVMRTSDGVEFVVALTDEKKLELAKALLDAIRKGPTP